jgi:anti-sigma factor RsiW
MDLNPIEDERLSARVDGQLDGQPEQRARVEAWLREHPQDAERVRQWSADRAALRERLAPMLDEPVPPWLQALAAGRHGRRAAAGRWGRQHRGCPSSVRTEAGGPAAPRPPRSGGSGCADPA